MEKMVRIAPLILNLFFEEILRTRHRERVTYADKLAFED